MRQHSKAKDIILEKADELAHMIYSVTKAFPKSETFRLVSPLRRASVSVPLNIVEGYARYRTKSHIHFLEFAYGSAKETQYLVNFSYKEGFISDSDLEIVNALSGEVCRMIFSKVRTLKGKLE